MKVSSHVAWYDYSIMIMNIGKKIREVLDNEGHNACWLAERIPCERSNVYNIFRRESISVDLLFRISEVLEYDFFKEISDELALRLAMPDSGAAVDTSVAVPLAVGE